MVSQTQRFVWTEGVGAPFWTGRAQNLFGVRLLQLSFGVDGPRFLPAYGEHPLPVSQEVAP